MRVLGSAPKFEIKRRFGRAATVYENSAQIQREVASSVAAMIEGLPLPASASVLEIGCGTGYLTRAVLDRRPHVEWLATDIAVPMLEACRDRDASARLRIAAMDGEQLAIGPGRFDLICSSLALQWMQDPAAAIRAWTQLLKPGGWIVASTLGAGTFVEWRAAQVRADLPVVAPDYPTRSGFRHWWPDHDLQLSEFTLHENFDRAVDFLRNLRQIGADTPLSGRTRSAAQLRRALSLLETAQPVRISYHVLIGVWRASG